MQRRTLLLLAAAALVLVLALAGLLAWRAGDADRGGQASAVGGPFQLVDQHGRAVDESVLKGRWSAVFFGFTYCPDVCPTTMFTLKQAQDLLGPRAQDLQVVFISVDPERDTPAQLAAYLGNDAFPRGALGLTGSPEQVGAAAKAYKVFYEKAGEGEGYLVNHSTVTYLMSPKGRFVCALPYGITPEQTAERIGRAMREGVNAQGC